MPANVAVIVAAAGAGSRFGGPVKKTFVPLDGRAVFLRSIELFVNRDDVCQVILAVSDEDYEMVKNKFGPNLGFMSVKLVKGGEKRWQTIQNALDAVPDQAELVAVHDAVRVCLTADKITEVFEAAQKTGAAILARPVNATVKRVADDNTIQATLDRNNLYLAQTPQVFKKQLLIDAYNALDPDADVTDDAQVVEHAGHKVTIVEGDETNIKITHGNDLKLAAAILKILPKPKKEGPTGPWAGEIGWK